ncbi:MAG: hypothetical protein D3916_10940 [Candidatus Electrothrix sp. MAN1_4]|nr:hypothetical protein [Candidatus Electrothrix sp. MAN1_4]
MFRTLKFLITDSILWCYLVPFRALIRLLPRKAVYGMAKAVAPLLYLIERKKGIHQTCEDFFQGTDKTLSQDQIVDISKKSYEIFVTRHFEDIFMGHLRPEDLAQMVDIEGREHLDAALAEDKGVIIQLAHFGSFMMILPALAFKGYTVNQLVGNPHLKHHRPIHRLMFEAKVKENSLLPVTFIHADKSVRTVVNALKNNELVAMALDGRDANEWVKAPMAGKTVILSPGNLRLASMTGALILPTFMISQGNNRYKLIIEEPFRLEQIKDKEEFLKKNMERLAKIFEKYFLQHPSHIVKTLNELQYRADKGVNKQPFFERRPKE